MIKYWHEIHSNSQYEILPLAITRMAWEKLFSLLLMFSRQVVSTLWLHRLQKRQVSRLPRSPRVRSDSRPLSRWSHPTISSSVVPFSSCPQSSPASGSFSESALPIWWPEYWSFSFIIRPANEYSGLISIWMDWLDLLAVQGTLKSLLQHHSSKASVSWRATFFMVHPYMTTGDTVTLTVWTFVGKVISAFWYAV